VINEQEDFMAAANLHQVARRLLANVDAEQGDESDRLVEIPTERYTDPARHQREVDQIFHRHPLLVALSCDVREPGQFSSLTIAGRAILVVRGEDGIARTFLNACRHRGAQVTPDCFGSTRRFTCPYHFWVYDTMGTLVGNTARAAFVDMDVNGLVQLETAERHGAIFATLTPHTPFDVDEWLGDMGDALRYIDLNGLHRHRDGLATESGNWKATADGYVDGYHLGYLHRNTIGAKSITNRNTYDLFSAHVRLGFANKPILSMRDLPDEEWNLREAMSLVHFIFPNVSISGLPGHGLMFSRINPGTSPTQSTVEQFQYFREPMVTEAQITDADAKRELYFAVTRDEDFATVFEVTRAAQALQGDVFRFGRNELGNQHFHQWAEGLAEGRTVRELNGTVLNGALLNGALRKEKRT
jgi:phenylpropionate dioxygenase-like ring-hydroxylating dioxygenase large terminal subunit